MQEIRSAFARGQFPPPGTYLAAVSMVFFFTCWELYPLIHSLAHILNHCARLGRTFLVTFFDLQRVFGPIGISPPFLGGLGDPSATPVPPQHMGTICDGCGVRDIYLP